MITEIKVGNWFRTEDGIIDKVIVIHKKEMLIVGTIKAVNIEGIKEYAENLVDIIHEGDYINGNKVVNINGNLFVDDYWLPNMESGIRSVVTREQFEEMEYKVGVE